MAKTAEHKAKAAAPQVNGANLRAQYSSRPHKECLLARFDAPIYTGVALSRKGVQELPAHRRIPVNKPREGLKLAPFAPDPIPPPETQGHGGWLEGRSHTLVFLSGSGALLRASVSPSENRPTPSRLYHVHSLFHARHWFQLPPRFLPEKPHDSVKCTQEQQIKKCHQEQFASTQGPN